MSHDRTGVGPGPAGDESMDVIDRYQIVARIGKGGMAEVFRAKLTSIGGFERDVALKVLLPAFAAEPEFVEMLLDEARIAGGIDHPNVLQVLDVGRKGDVFYLVMEYVDGLDLRSIAKLIPGGRVPLGMALYVVSEMLRGLDAVHTAVDERGQPRNIVHRDISPGNVMVDRRGFVKLGDFGIAHASGRITRTRVGAVKGKSRYMAPEQLARQPVDARADLYAVGVTLFEAILGDFARGSSRPTVYGPMFTWPERMPDDGMPADVEAILRRAITETPEMRYRDAVEFREELELALHRWAQGYGPDTLARELHRLGAQGPAATPIELDSTRSAKPARATPVPAPAVGVRPVRWRDPATVQTAPSEHTGTSKSELTPVQLGATGMPVAPAGAKPASTLSGTSSPALPGVAAPREPDFAASSGSGTPRASTNLLAPMETRGEKSLDRRLGIGLVVAALALVTIGIAAAVAGSGGAAALPVEETPRVQHVATPAQPHTTPLPSTGAIEVHGPVGASVQIGSVSYPPAPTRIELAPGDYVVKLRFGKKRRLLTYPVHVDAGHTSRVR